MDDQKSPLQAYSDADLYAELVRRSSHFIQWSGARQEAVQLYCKHNGGMPWDRTAWRVINEMAEFISTGKIPEQEKAAA